MMKFLTTFLPLMAAILSCYTAEAFSPVARPSMTRVQPLRSSEDDEVTLPTLPSQKDAAPVKVQEPVAAAPVAAPVTTSAVVKEEEEGTSYPIDLPSPVLLGASMVLAISGTGEYTFTIYYCLDIHLQFILIIYVLSLLISIT